MRRERCATTVRTAARVSEPFADRLRRLGRPEPTCPANCDACCPSRLTVASTDTCDRGVAAGTPGRSPARAGTGDGRRGDAQVQTLARLPTCAPAFRLALPRFPRGARRSTRRSTPSAHSPCGPCRRRSAATTGRTGAPRLCSATQGAHCPRADVRHADDATNAVLLHGAQGRSPSLR